MEAFGFEGGEEAFHDRIVVRICFAAHGSGCAARMQKALKRGAGILDAAV